MTFSEFLQTPKTAVECSTPAECKSLIKKATAAGYKKYDGTKLTDDMYAPGICFTADPDAKILSPAGKAGLVNYGWTVIPFSELSV